jgi:hypothetical protein
MFVQRARQSGVGAVGAHRFYPSSWPVSLENLKFDIAQDNANVTARAAKEASCRLPKQEEHAR